MTARVYPWQIADARDEARRQAAVTRAEARASAEASLVKSAGHDENLLDQAELVLRECAPLLLALDGAQTSEARASVVLSLRRVARRYVRLVRREVGT